MRGRQIDDLAVGKHPLHLLLEVVPLDRPVEVVEGERAAAQQELAQVGDFASPSTAGCPARRCRSRGSSRAPGSSSVMTTGSLTWIDVTVRTPARQVLLRGRIVDRPGLVVDVVAAARAAASTRRSGRGRTSTAGRRIAHPAPAGRLGVQPASAHPAASSPRPDSRQRQVSRSSHVTFPRPLEEASPAPVRRSARFPGRTAPPSSRPAAVRRADRLPPRSQCAVALSATLVSSAALNSRVATAASRRFIASRPDPLCAAASNGSSATMRSHASCSVASSPVFSASSASRRAGSTAA